MSPSFFLNTMVPAIIVGMEKSNVQFVSIENICYLKFCGFSNCASLKPEPDYAVGISIGRVLRTQSPDNRRLLSTGRIDSKPRRPCTIVKRIENRFRDKLPRNSSTKLKRFPLFRLFRKKRMIIFRIGIEAIFREL